MDNWSDEEVEISLISNDKPIEEQEDKKSDVSDELPPIDFDDEIFDEDKKRKHEEITTVYCEDVMDEKLADVGCIKFIKNILTAAIVVKQIYSSQTNRQDQLKHLEIHNPLHYALGLCVTKDHSNIYNIIPYLKWMLQAMKELTFSIQQEAYILSLKTNYITRQSYQFCPNGGNCDNFYLSNNEKEDCTHHHYVHALLYNDINSLLNFLLHKNENEAKKREEQFNEIVNKSRDGNFDSYHYDQSYYKNETNRSHTLNPIIFNDTELNEIEKSISTIHFVIGHMSREIVLYDNILGKIHDNTNNINKYHRSNLNFFKYSEELNV